MRRFVIAAIAVVEAAVGCGIFVCSLHLSRDIQRSETLGRVAHAVERSTQHIALEVRTRLRILT